MNKRLQIVKVGGSLFELADLSNRLIRWLELQENFFSILIPGCGKLGDTIRYYDEKFHLGNAVCHNLCADLLEIQSNVLQNILPKAEFLKTCNQIHDWIHLKSAQSYVAVFQTKDFLLHEEKNISGEKLPIGWDVTTDSIAARIAEVSAANELVLLKSADPPKFSELAELSDCNYVDKYFPWAARPLSEVRFVNLANNQFPEWYVFE